MMKRCTKCGKTKRAEEFSKNKRAGDGLYSWCKKCAGAYSLGFYHRNRDRYLAQQKTYRDKNREAKRAYDRKHSRRHDLSYRYGLSLNEYDDLLLAQDGRCAICLSILARPNVDHDHVTKRTRGLLCTPCNQGIGFFRDDVKLMRSAIRYIEGRPKKT